MFTVTGHNADGTETGSPLPTDTFTVAAKIAQNKLDTGKYAYVLIVDQYGDPVRRYGV